MTTFDAFHPWPHGRLDRQYLRQCAAYRLLARGKIGAAGAVEIMAQRKVTRPERLSITSPDGRNLGRWGIGETRDEIAVKLAASGYTLHPDNTITGPPR